MIRIKSITMLNIIEKSLESNMGPVMKIKTKKGEEFICLGLTRPNEKGMLIRPLNKNAKKIKYKDVLSIQFLDTRDLFMLTENLTKKSKK